MLLFLQYLSHRARLLIFIYLNFYRQSNIKRQQVNCGSGRWGTEQSGVPRTSSFNGSTGAPRQSGAGRRPGGRITGAGRRAGGAERGGGRTPPPRRVRGAVQHVRERQLGQAEDTAPSSKSLSNGVGALHPPRTSPVREGWSWRGCVDRFIGADCDVVNVICLSVINRIYNVMYC